VVTTEPTKQQVENVLEKFIGNIVQTSPVYSAVKIQGERAYKKARRGESFVSPPRIVTIKEIEILNYTFPILKIRVVVGSGTYIRSLAREIGESLQTGAYLTTLIRTRVGMYIVAEAKKI
jgi:tRNA pseudouridine55 synthase